jgi:hypothetical protein
LTPSLGVPDVLFVLVVLAVVVVAVVPAVVVVVLELLPDDPQPLTSASAPHTRISDDNRLGIGLLTLA